MRHYGALDMNMAIRFFVLTSAVWLTLLGTTISATAEKRVALVIGNSAYENVSRLPNPGNDAEAIAKALKRLGFEVTLKRDLTYGKLRRALGAFSSRAAGADLTLLYYAGHGIEVGGSNYLIPTDARLRHADDVDYEAMPLAVAMNALSRANRLKLVILDACRDNPFAANMSRTGATRSIGRGLARVEPRGSDTLVAYAAKGGTTANDGDGKHSPYTSALLQHLETPNLDIRLLFGRVRDTVLSETGRKQEPFTYGSLGGTALYLKSAKTASQSNQSPDTSELADLRKRLAALEAERKKWKQRKQPANKEPKVAVGVFPKQSNTASRKPFEPEVVYIPGGTFQMGCVSGKDCHDDEKPVHKVTVGSFYMSKYETTFGQWDACVADGGCKHKPVNEGWGRGSRPVINVSWNDAVQYAKWLSKKTGQTWRLPTEAEWEYAARAGSKTRYSWENDIGKNRANCDGCGSQWDNKKTAPVGSFNANAFGLHDMHGNVSEWTVDCYNDSYKGRTGGRQRVDVRGVRSPCCSRRFLGQLSEGRPVGHPLRVHHRQPGPQHRISFGQNVKSLIFKPLRLGSRA